MSVEKVQGRQRELRWPGIWGDAQCHWASLLKPEIAEPRIPEHCLEAQLGNSRSQDQMEGLQCINRIAKGKDWENRKEEMSFLGTHGQWQPVSGPCMAGTRGCGSSHPAELTREPGALGQLSTSSAQTSTVLLPAVHNCSAQAAYFCSIS